MCPISVDQFIYPLTYSYQFTWSDIQEKMFLLSQESGQSFYELILFYAEEIFIDTRSSAGFLPNKTSTTID